MNHRTRLVYSYTRYVLREALRGRSSAPHTLPVGSSPIRSDAAAAAVGVPPPELTLTPRLDLGRRRGLVDAPLPLRESRKDTIAMPPLLLALLPLCTMRGPDIEAWRAGFTNEESTLPALTGKYESSGTDNINYTDTRYQLHGTHQPLT